MLNDRKADMRKTEITFMGHLITKEGIRADSTKVTVICDMPSPTYVHGVKRFCGMIQYLARFMPNLAHMSEPLRHLIKKYIAWNWSPECENALQAIKHAISQPPVLAFYNQNLISYFKSAVQKMALVLFYCKMTSPHSRNQSATGHK